MIYFKSSTYLQNWVDNSQLHIYQSRWWPSILTRLISNTHSRAPAGLLRCKTWSSPSPPSNCLASSLTKFRNSLLLSLHSSLCSSLCSSLFSLISRSARSRNRCKLHRKFHNAKTCLLEVKISDFSKFQLLLVLWFFFHFELSKNYSPCVFF